MKPKKKMNRHSKLKNTVSDTLTPDEYRKLVRMPRSGLKSKAKSKQYHAFRHIIRSHEGIVEEYKFLPGRRFRFDAAIPDKMIAIEYEGIKGKSRHTTLTGYTGDCNKYNLAALSGWRILRYTCLNYMQLWDDLKLILTK